MSDFLNQFDKNNYNKNTPSTKSQPQTPTFVTVDAEPTRSANSDNRKEAAIQGPVHNVEVDRSFHRNKLIRYIVIAAAVIAVCLTGVFIFRLTNRIDVKPLVGTDINEAKSWALRNRIDLDITYEFDLEKNKDIIMVQFPESGGKIQRGSLVSVTVSSGADPDEVLSLPDFSSMDISEVRAWRTQYKANNINVIQEYNDSVEKGKFIKSEFPNDMVNESNYTRKDMMNIYMSRGDEEIRKNITVQNFTKKTKEEVVTWADTNKIRLTIDEEPSDEILENLIISQSVKPGVKLAANDEITVVVSIGEGVEVPNFNNISQEKSHTVEGLQVDVSLKYSNSASYGRVISQSVAAGTKLYKNNKKVDVVYSLGRPFIDNMVGSSERDLPAYFHDFTSKGANITYTTEYVDSSEPKGSIIYSTHNSEFIDFPLNVHLQISRGNLEPPQPQFPDYDLP